MLVEMRLEGDWVTVTQCLQRENTSTGRVLSRTDKGIPGTSKWIVKLALFKPEIKYITFKRIVVSLLSSSCISLCKTQPQVLPKEVNTENEEGWNRQNIRPDNLRIPSRLNNLCTSHKNAHCYLQLLIIKLYFCVYVFSLEALIFYSYLTAA